MTQRLTVAGKQALDYCDKFPDTPNKALARKLLNDFPLLYSTLEHARSLVRNFRGGSKRAGYKTQAQTKTKFSATNPYNLPESYAEKREPFVLPTSCNSILVVSDLHVPYHDIAAVSAALKFGVENKVNCVFINGDLIDFHGLSRFDKDPRKRSVKQEIEAAISILKTIRKTLPNAGIYYHLGNHDIRYQNWLRVKVTEIFDDEYYQLETRLGLIGLRIKLIDDKTVTHAGKLKILHGHTVFKGLFTSVSPARTMYLKLKQSSICGHTHKESTYTATNLDGDLTTCWSTGSLCELSPDYNPHGNDYCHGFAHAVINKDKSFSVKNYRIKDGKIL